MTTVTRSDTLSRRSFGLWALTAAFIAGALTTVLSGCRFGNHVTSNTNPDTLSGYYGTAPQSLQFCASHASTTCKDMPTNQVPTLISAEMSNPVALILQDLETGDAVLTAYNSGRTALPVWVGADNSTLYYVNSFSPQAIWKDGKCTSRLYLEEEGTIVPGEAVAVPGSSRLTSGRITLRVRVTEVFEDASAGACETTLQAMASCYQDVNQCGGGDTATNQALQEQVQSIFEPYIQAQAMTAADIAHVTNVAYEIQYQ